MGRVITDAPAVPMPRSAPPSLGTPFESAVMEGPESGDAVVEGAMPAWLRGRLVRTAPALFAHGSWAAQHWFDGLGMLYAIEIGEAGVRFRQRLLECRASDEILRRGRSSSSTFATANGRSFLRRVFEPIPRMTDNANVHVVPWSDGHLAMTETMTQIFVDDALRTRRAVTYDDAIGKRSGMLAHPELDRATGDLVNLAVRIGPKVDLIPYRQRKGTFTREPFAKLTLPELAYVHSFGLTERTMVLVLGPWVGKPLSLLWSNGGLADHLRFDRSRPTRVVIFDRATGATRVVETDPMLVFHVANAWDDGGDLVVDVAAYDDARIVDALRWPEIDGGFRTPATLRRVRVPSAGARATVSLLDDGDTFEFPVVNRRAVAGRRHGVVWGMALETVEGVIRSRVRRVSTDGGPARAFSREHVVYGEPVFVPRPGGEAEDDGVLLAVGSDLVKRRAEVVVLSADRLEPLATAHLPIPLPLGFHGSFRPERA